jgi:hypothetical protein
MALTDTDREAIDAALASRRAEDELSRRVRQNLIEERRRRSKEDLAEQERLARGVVAAAGMELADLQRRRQRSAEEARGVLEAQRQVISEHSGAAAERQRFNARAWVNGLRAQNRLAATPYTLTTLDTAAQITHGPIATPQGGQYVEVGVDPISPMHNVANAVIGWNATPEIGSGVTGPWWLDLYWVFTFPVAEDHDLNAMTFVQALGAYSLDTVGWFFGGSDAQAFLTTRLDLWIAGQQLDPGDFNHGPIRRLHSGPWNPGIFDAGAYNYEPGLFDNNFSYVRGGSTVYIIVSVHLEVGANGWAYSELDFRSGNFQISVPAVVVNTFPPTTIT